MLRNLSKKIKFSFSSSSYLIKLNNNCNQKRFSIFNKLKTFIEPSAKDLTNANSVMSTVDPNDITVKYYDDGEDNAENNKKLKGLKKDKNETISKNKNKIVFLL